jgi:hypothetical protein
MKLTPVVSKVISKKIIKLIVFTGNSLTLIGCSGLVLAVIEVIEADFFAVGISSGIRVIGSVAISGCLLSAIGYGAMEYIEK